MPTRPLNGKDFWTRSAAGWRSGALGHRSLVACVLDGGDKRLVGDL